MHVLTWNNKEEKMQEITADGKFEVEGMFSLKDVIILKRIVNLTMKIKLLLRDWRGV